MWINWSCYESARPGGQYGIEVITGSSHAPPPFLFLALTIDSDSPHLAVHPSALVSASATSVSVTRAGSFHCQHGAAGPGTALAAGLVCFAAAATLHEFSLSLRLRLRRRRHRSGHDRPHVSQATAAAPRFCCCLLLLLSLLLLGWFGGSRSRARRLGARQGLATAPCTAVSAVA
jgi:hypothetical protein